MLASALQKSFWHRDHFKASSEIGQPALILSGSVRHHCNNCGCSLGLRLYYIQIQKGARSSPDSRVRQIWFPLPQIKPRLLSFVTLSIIHSSMWIIYCRRPSFVSSLGSLCPYLGALEAEGSLHLHSCQHILSGALHTCEIGRLLPFVMSKGLSQSLDIGLLLLRVTSATSPFRISISKYYACHSLKYHRRPVEVWQILL